LKKLGADQLRAGSPVAFDCYDGQGHLILKRGSIVDSVRQLEFLLERGLFDLSVVNGSGDEGGDVPRVERASSPFHRLAECYRRLESLLPGSRESGNKVDADKSAATAFPSPTQLLTDFLQGKDIGLNDVDPDKPHPFPGQVLQLATELQAICASDAEAVVGALHLDTTGNRYSISHSLSRALICELLAVRCRIPPRNRRQLMAAALTCDMSMLQLQDELACHEGPLRPEHQQAIKDHPQQTVALLAALGAIDPSWTNAVIQHHEFPDGKGYPAGLSAKAISPWARILKLADTYAAMVSQRSYRKPAQTKEVLRQFFQRRGSEFDEELAALFVNEFGAFPPGLIVRLYNGEHAVVIRRGAKPRTPIVKAVVGPRGAILAPSILRTTDIPEYEIVEVLERNSVPALDMNELWGYDDGLV
jgi:hypothetical protein